MLTQDQVDAYHRDGYIIATGFLDAEEIDLLRRSAIEDRQLDRKAIGMDPKLVGKADE